MSLMTIMIVIFEELFILLLFKSLKIQLFYICLFKNKFLKYIFKFTIKSLILKIKKLLYHKNCKFYHKKNKKNNCLHFIYTIKIF